MELKSFNLLVVGVGGQGVIRAVQILSLAALMDNYKVRTAETHGMAQRGGSVSSFLRFGNEVEGPLIPRGDCQVFLALEASEAVRYFRYANSDTFFLINNEINVPPTIHLMNMEYPNVNEIFRFLQQVSHNIFIVDAYKEAMKAGDPRVLNVYMIGVSAGAEVLPISINSLKRSIMRLVPTKAQTINKNAFEEGIKKGKLLKGEIKLVSQIL
ncbi:MAG: indolepyruvate oxidoreductase subunit beta [Promethearchaeota archaeon]|jgi:indolepyruvate ferredoxin oxidoreductase beta subunit